MKKSILIIIFIICCSLLISVYFVGEKSKTELPKQIMLLNSEGIKVELLNYEKSFFTAKADLNISIPLDGQPPLQFFVHSDIAHYPHKVKATNHIRFLDQQLEKRVSSHFQNEKWLTSMLEVNLLGHLTGQSTLAEGNFKGDHETLNTAPLFLTYRYDFADESGALTMVWPGFNGQVDQEKFAAKTISFTTDFTKVTGSRWFDYQYNAQVGQFDFLRKTQRLALKMIALKGENKIGDDLLTVNTKSNWHISELQNGQQKFINNKVELSLSDLNISALYAFKASLSKTGFSPKALSYLLSLGAHIDLQTLHSETPWGDVDAQLLMDIQAGLKPAEIQANPLSLIDYTNGKLMLTLPEELALQPSLSGIINMGLRNRVLKLNVDQLTLESTLDRGELTINGDVIPL